MLCAGGRDTTTDAGWESAVRSVGDGTAHVHQVLAAATTYATAVRSGIPINPAAQAAINFAIDQIGLPYVWGGNGPELGDSGFDCSGLLKAAYATAGVELPRTAHSQYFATRRVPNGAELQPGDLLFYGNPATHIHHVGLYIGNGQMINAPTFGMPVQVADYRAAGRDFAGAGRPV
jgi:cell wall-associated NlpC family hydrolase